MLSKVKSIQIGVQAELAGAGPAPTVNGPFNAAFPINSGSRPFRLTASWINCGKPLYAIRGSRKMVQI